MSCLKCNVLPDKPICKEIEPVGSGKNLTSISGKKQTMHLRTWHFFLMEKHQLCGEINVIN